MGKNKHLIRVVKIVFIFAFFFVVTNYIGVACGQNSQQVSDLADASCNPTQNSNKNFSPTTNEEPYCTTNITYVNAVTVTGVAQFNILPSNNSGFGAETLGGTISYAEVQVLDQNNNIIQCSETGPNGEINFQIPKNLNNVRVKVNSRANNNFVKTSVLNNSSEEKYYSISTTFNTTNLNTFNLGTLTATATGTLEGGAFNIYYNILRANNSLRYFNPTFTVAPKSVVYWTKGLNPNVYVGGSSTLGVSFYLIGSGRLYILGGINGDVDSSDHDHFDDSIISHEYGHFIEDTYSKTDSPGGLHTGNQIIDARLAWGEGWANFFSSAIRADKFYKDCYGTQSGSTGCFLNYNIDTNTQSGIPGTAIDVASSSGEGNFREFAITRALWDAVDPIRNIASGPTSGNNIDIQNAQDNVTQPFSNFWNAFSGNFASNSEHFRSVGKFLFMNNDATLNTSNVFNADKILPNMKDFAQPLPTTTAPGCNAGQVISIQANDPSSYSMSGQTICVRGNLHHFCSNQFASNDFYDVNYDGSFSTISIQKTSSDNTELDLYLYKTPYVFGNRCDIAAQSNIGNAATKTISFVGLAYGHYMLNVNVYTGNGNPAAASTYKIFVNSNQVCP